MYLQDIPWSMEIVSLHREGSLQDGILDDDVARLVRVHSGSRVLGYSRMRGEDEVCPSVRVK